MRVVQIVGWSNSGKTTLTQKLAAHFSAENVETSTIKHHGKAEKLHLDQGNTDTAKHRRAGAVSSLLSSSQEQQWNINKPLSLSVMVEMHMLLGADLLLIEGYKHADYPKIEMITPKKPLQGSTNIIASVSWNSLQQQETIEKLGEIIWNQSEIIS